MRRDEGERAYENKALRGSGTTWVESTARAARAKSGVYVKEQARAAGVHRKIGLVGISLNVVPEYNTALLAIHVLTCFPLSLSLSLAGPVHCGAYYSLRYYSQIHNDVIAWPFV